MLILVYVARVQAIYYPVARDVPWIRRLFTRSRELLFSAWALWLTICLIHPFRIYDLQHSLPPLYLLDLVFEVPALIVSLLAAHCFARALGEDFQSLRQSAQNGFAALGLSGSAGVTVVAIAADFIRVFGDQNLMSVWLPRLLDIQHQTIIVEVVGLATAITCYYSRGLRDEYAERFLRVLGVVDEITKLVENAPIRKASLSLQYQSLWQAMGPEHLGLGEQSKRRADDAFRAMVIETHGAGDGGNYDHRNGQGLAHLAVVHDKQLEALVGSEASLRKAHGDQEAPSMLSGDDLVPTLRNNGGLKGGGSPHGHRVSDFLRWAFATADGAGTNSSVRNTREMPRWAQVCAVAAADAGLLREPLRRRVLQDRKMVAQEIIDAYHLGKHKLRNTPAEDDLPAEDGIEPHPGWRF